MDALLRFLRYTHPEMAILQLTINADVKGNQEIAELAQSPTVGVLCHEFPMIDVRAKDVGRYDVPVSKVILVRQLSAESPPDLVTSTCRCFTVSPRPEVFAGLLPFLSDTTGKEHVIHSQSHPTCDVLEELLRGAVGDTLAIREQQTWLDVANVKGLRKSRDRFVSTITALLNTNDLWRWQYGLDLLTSDYAKETHAWHSRYDRPYEQELYGQPSIETGWKVHRLLEACADLRASLTCRLATDNYGSEHVTDQNEIVIIDDSPDSAFGATTFEKFVTVVVRAFAPHLVVRFLNPRRGFGAQFDYLKLYATLAGESHSDHMPERQHVSRTLAQELRNARYVVVDQFFRDPLTDREAFDGPQIVRGLNRFLRDFVGGVKQELAKNWKVPEIVALSRTDEADRIQDALRAGARDYVVKRRILALPAALARVSFGTSELPPPLRRNFRALYNLPNETIGLLREVRVPPVALHRSTRRPLQTTEKRMADVLRALPKTDLHVHVGSCMQPEFLAIASLVGLARDKRGAPFLDALRAAAGVFGRAVQTIGGTHWSLDISIKSSEAKGDVNIDFATELSGMATGEDWIHSCADAVKNWIKTTLRKLKDKEMQCKSFRSILHQQLNIPDYLRPGEAILRLCERPTLQLALFALRNSRQLGEFGFSNDDLIRVYLLVLAAGAKAVLTMKGVPDGVNLLDLFRGEQSSETISWLRWALDTLHKELYESAKGLSITGLRRSGWTVSGLPHDVPSSAQPDNGGHLLSFRWSVQSGREPAEISENHGTTHREAGDLSLSILESVPDFKNSAIQWTLATGLRCGSLAEYLEGCEFAGAIHLQHPFLMHLYAQQAVVEFIDRGAFYVELRGSPDGYVDSARGFEFPDACACLVEAFSQAQRQVLDKFRGGEDSSWLADALGPRYALKRIGERMQPNSEPLARYLPCKVSLIFVGKRHKPTREVILEAAAAAVMKPAAVPDVKSARDFREEDMDRCRVVGFDLAGQEPDHPPQLFQEEFSRLSRLHIPLTVHAGEQASSQFIEDAILKLGARRIGHGLTLMDDPGLMARVREQHVAIELCPVSNHQTCQYGPPESKPPWRRYPLKEYLEAGLLVTINTDNPIVSHTDLVHEYLQASYSYGGTGLSLWDALRIMRTGYVTSFLSLPERRALLEIVDQFLFDLFSNQSVIELLRDSVWSGKGHEKSR
jgi:adenosine deaminase